MASCAIAACHHQHAFAAFVAFADFERFFCAHAAGGGSHAVVKAWVFYAGELDAMVGSFAIANGLATSKAIALVRISFFMMYVPFGGVVRAMYSKFGVSGDFLHCCTFACLA